jgi:tetratricopeptide (TPR) repeat protein
VNLKRHRAKIAISTTLLFAAAVPRAFPVQPATPSPSRPSSALLESAQRQFGAGNYSAAVAMLRSVASQDPLSAEAFYWLGRCYYEMRDLDRAIAHAQKAVALQPQNSVYQQWLGRDYAAKADRDKSFFTARKVKTYFEQAVQLDPANVSARRDLEEFCIQAPWIVGGSNDEAKTQVDAIAKIDPIAGHLARASFDIEALKRPDLAEGEYKQILAAEPADPEPYFDIVAFLQRQNRPADMNAVLEAVAGIDANDPRVSFYRAEAMILSGSNLDRAAEYIKSFLASTPDRSDWPSHAAAREWLGRLYEKQGRPAEAAEQYRASLQLEPWRKSAQTRLERLEKAAL